MLSTVSNWARISGFTWSTAAASRRCRTPTYCETRRRSRTSTTTDSVRDESSDVWAG